MKNLKTLLVLLFLSTVTSQLYAHALWIETASTGKKGQAHEIKVFYGEYASKELEETGKWYSDVKDFTLWLTAPGKEKIKLTTTAGANFFSASFTPESDGVYFLTVSHEAKDLGGSTKYEFSSVAAVAVGKINAVNHLLIPNAVKMATSEAKIFKINTPVQMKVIVNGQPVANKPVSVFSPEGWSRDFKTDTNGNLSFTPIWLGRYVLELSHFEKTSGEHNGKEYSAAWQGSTYSFEVSK